MVKQLDENALNIYTDGSCYPSPRVGGIGFLFVTVDEDGHPVIHEESPPGWRGATNNQMELQACIEALGIATGRHAPFDLSDFRKIVIYTDSRYVTDNFNNAKFVWPKSKWMTRDGPPVANMRQWKELLKLVHRAGVRVEIEWVKGHKNDPHNKAVDRLARKSAKMPTSRTLEPERVRRKKSPLKAETGSVRMEGQDTAVRIIRDKYLPPPQRCYRYMYEVTDEESEYFQRVDYITSDLMLSAGHTYRVRLNTNTRDPRIVENFGEIAEV